MMKGEACHPPVVRLSAILPLKSTQPLLTKVIDSDENEFPSYTFVSSQCMLTS